jgi:hypothetical protein
VSNFVSKNVRTPLKVVANATLALGLAVGGTGLAAAVTAPAAQAAASFCCSGSLSASPTDPGLVTVTITNIGTATDAVVALTNPGGTITVPLAAASVLGHYDAQFHWVPAVPSVTTMQFRLQPGQTAQASVYDIQVGDPYTNPGVTAPQFITPDAVTRAGNVVTVPVAKAGVQYFIEGGVNKPLSAQQITLRAGQTLTVVAMPTVPPVAPLTGTTSWTFSYMAAQVTPEAPTLISGNLYKVPAGSGYHYEVAGKVVTGTVYATPEGTVVNAVSDSASLELVGQTSWPLDYATPPTPVDTRKIMICTPTGSETNPWNPIMVPVNALQGHEGGIWPASDGVEANNWTEANAAIYADNCEAPTPPPSNGGDNDDHGGNTTPPPSGGGNTGGGTTTPPSGGGNTTPPPSSGNTGGGTTTGTGSTTSTTPVTTTTTKESVTGNQPAGSGLLVKAETGVNPSTDPTSINVIGGLSVMAAIGAFALSRRPKHRAE